MIKPFVRFPISAGIGALVYFVSGGWLMLACLVAGLIELTTLIVLLTALRKEGDREVGSFVGILVSQYIVSHNVELSDIMHMIFFRIFACMITSFAVGFGIWLFFIAIGIYLITMLHVSFD